MNKRRGLDLLVGSARIGVTPLLFYFGFFFILTYPEVTRFSTHLFADGGDGLQNAWNLWWVREAVTRLRQSPWRTNYLHWPYGTSLLGHTLNPFNGFLGIPLARFMTLTEIYNFIVVFSFAAGGLTAFLLARYVTESYFPGLIAGFIFTFSNYHFAHAQGHLNLVSLEWIPLFLLLWLKLLSNPRVWLAVGAAIALFLVILCDYYYFLYCVLAAVIIFGWNLIGERRKLVSARDGLLAPLVVFCLVAAATSGVLAGSLVWLELKDPLTGAHSPREFSLDLLAPFVYGGHWRFANLTKGYWSRLPGDINESSVHLGLSVVVVLLYVWRKRKLVGARRTELWFLIMLFYAVLALGPTLHVWGRAIPRISLPYAWLGAVFPLLKISGVPIRMMVMVVLSAGVISAFGFKLLFRGSRRERVLAGALLALLLIEYLPKQIPTLRVEVPGYVEGLRALPGPGGVLDTASYYTLALYYQTVYEKPMAFGYLARLPASVVAQDRELARTMDGLYVVAPGQGPGLSDADIRWALRRLGSPDPEGDNREIRRGGYSLAARCVELLSGGEQLSDAVFVERAYQRLLGREPDEPGMNGYVEALAGGRSTRAQVAGSFLTSAEFQRLIPRAVDSALFYTLSHKYRIRYLVSEGLQRFKDSPDVRPVWNDGRVWIFDIAGAKPGS